MLNVKHILLIFLILSTGASLHTLNSNVFILHGSFGSASRWYRPGGAFYENVAAEAQGFGHTVSPFLWSGGITQRSIIEAAGALVKRILELPPASQIILLAHSNGGNVCAYASMLLGELYKTLSDEAMTPITLKKPFEIKKLTKNRNFIYEVPPKIENLIDQTFASLRKAVDLKHYIRRALPDYPIQLICLMGTPIDVTRFDVDMQVVKQVINLYSSADFVQALVGEQMLPLHERRANIQTKIHITPEQDNPIDPCHKNIRNPIIGKWLLHLPAVLTATPENSNAALASGTAIFYNDKKPDFQAGVYSSLEESKSDPDATESDSLDSDNFDDSFVIE